MPRIFRNAISHPKDVRAPQIKDHWHRETDENSTQI
jgi:hypothetical protein